MEKCDKTSSIKYQFRIEDATYKLTADQRRFIKDLYEKNINKNK